MGKVPDNVITLIRMSLDEDIGSGDVTSLALVGPEIMGKAVIEAREDLVCCGLPIASEIYEMLDREVQFTPVAVDGREISKGEKLAVLEGSLRSILAGERTALNFLQRLCGVATMSRQYAQRAAGLITVLDSRKTIPGWRWLDKLAVRTGGCTNHRMGLYDGILIKDNHIRACGGIGVAVQRARGNSPEGMKIEVEVEDIKGLQEAIDAGTDIVMLDNFTIESISEAVKVAGKKVLLEVSGGISLDDMNQLANIGGIDFISVGALTHSAPAADIAMEFL